MTAYTSQYQGQSVRRKRPQSNPLTCIRPTVSRKGVWHQILTPIHSSVHGRIISGTYTRLYTWENHVVDLYTLLYKGESYAVPVHVSIHVRIMLLTHTQFSTREDHVRYIYTSRYMGGSVNHVTDVYKLLYTGESYQVHIHLSIHGRITLWTCIQFCTPENHVRCL